MCKGIPYPPLKKGGFWSSVGGGGLPPPVVVYSTLSERFSAPKSDLGFSGRFFTRLGHFSSPSFLFSQELYRVEKRGWSHTPQGYTLSRQKLLPKNLFPDFLPFPLTPSPRYGILLVRREQSKPPYPTTRGVRSACPTIFKAPLLRSIPAF